MFIVFCLSLAIRINLKLLKVQVVSSTFYWLVHISKYIYKPTKKK